MKPIYDECTLKWRVQGKGLFDTPQEAWQAIRESELSKMLTLMVSPKMMRKLREVAGERKMSVSNLVRQAIEKEVNANG